MKKFVFLFIFFIQYAYCQKDSLKTYQLPEFEIGQNRLRNFSIGTKFVIMDSAVHQNTSSLAELLQLQNYLLIKSYSPGNLATPTFRGTSANHTAVLWNGFNLQSAMNGQADFSLIPNAISSQTKIQFGGNGALNGSGAVGGTIHLQNLPVFNRGISTEINVQTGSFGALRQTVSVELGKKNWISSFKIFNNEAKNNFEFQNKFLPEKPIQTQQNAVFQIKGLLTEHFLRHKNHNLNIRYWLQSANRQIPPTMLAAQNLASQVDLSNRLTSEYSYQKNKIYFATRAAWFNEKIKYQRPLYDTVSNTANTFILEAESKIQIGNNQQVNIGFNNTYSVANGNNLPNSTSLNRTAIFASYQIQFLDKKLIFNANVREQLDKGKLTPFTFGCGLEAKPTKEITLLANANRSYRLPTLNDYFWRDAGGAKGNLNLKPELGWSQDIGIVFKKSINNFVVQANATFFNSNINNWIGWFQNDFGILSPQNIQSVWARGFEYGGKINYIKNKFQSSLTLNADYTLSTTESASQNFSFFIGKQIIYVPYNKGFVSLFLKYNKTSLTYNFAYTGFRFSNEDNSEFLPAFYVSNISINQYFNYRKTSFSVFAQFNNIFNQQYQVLAMRPMYGFNFNFGLTFKFNQPNKS